MSAGHGYVAYSHGCRCDECRAAKAAYMREKRAAVRQYAGPAVDEQRRRYVAPDVKHGTAHAYKDASCRCLDCTAYKAAESRRQWAKKKAAS